MSSTDLHHAHRGLVFLWGGLLGGQLLFALVMWLVASGLLGGEPWPGALQPGTARVLLLVPVALLGVGLVARRRRLPTGMPGPEALNRYQARFVFAAVAQEAGAVFGIGLALLAGEPRWILMVAGMTTFVMIRIRPRRRELERLIRS
jgi:hypothetical protein